MLLLLVGGVRAALVVLDRWRSGDGLHANSDHSTLCPFRWLIFGDHRRIALRWPGRRGRVLRRAIATGLVALGLGTYLAVQIKILDQIERAFYRGGVDLIGRWWNGQLGRAARRDIWLRHEHVWRVEARQGDGHAHVWTHDYASEREARAAIAAMIERTGGRNEWRKLATDAGPKGPIGTADTSH
jgi:hypothetical protein